MPAFHAGDSDSSANGPFDVVDQPVIIGVEAERAERLRDPSRSGTIMTSPHKVSADEQKPAGVMGRNLSLARQVWISATLPIARTA